MRRISGSYFERYIWYLLPVNLLLTIFFWNYFSKALIIYLYVFSLLFWLFDIITLRLKNPVDLLTDGNQLYSRGVQINPVQISSIQEVTDKRYRWSFQTIIVKYYSGDKKESLVIVAKPRPMWTKDRDYSPSVSLLIDTFPFLKHKMKRGKIE